MKRFTARVATVAVLASGLSVGAVAPASSMTLGATKASAVTTSPGATVTVREGVRTSIRGQVPQRFANSVVILEATRGASRLQLASVISNSRGRVSAPVDLGGAGKFQARWRVLKNGRSAWTSPSFPLIVKANGSDSRVAHSSFRMVDAARSGIQERTRIGNSRKGEDVQASNATKEAGESVREFWKGAFADAAAGDVIGVATQGVVFGIRKLLGRPSAAQVEQQDFTALTNQIAAGFDQVEAQLTEMENQLSSLEAQVSDVQQQVVTANASATATTCVADMNTASGHVDQIKTAVGNYKTVLDPQWIDANLVGQPRSSSLDTIGVEIFGSGPGQPPFATGVVQLQTAVSALGDLLTSGGPTSTGGLISTCASAVSAQVASEYYQDQIVAPGSLAAEYYQDLQSIASYYSSWLALGQRVASEGGELAAISYAGDAYDGSTPICAGATPSVTASIISCPGVAWYTQQSMSQFNTALSSVGASWNQVTMGRVGSDNRIAPDADFVGPAQNLWALDVALYGEDVPGLESSSSWSPTEPLNSLSVPSPDAPAGVRVTEQALGQPWWLGFTFTPATSAQWDRIIPGAGHPGNKAGALMADAGLLNYGQPPSELIVVTDETTTFNTGTATQWTAPAECPSGTQCKDFTSFGAQSLTALTFIDANLTIPTGNPIVIGPPTGTTTGTPMFANDVMPGADESADAQLCTVPRTSEKCSGSYGQALSMTAPVGSTAQPGFWDDLTQTNSYDVEVAAGETGVFVTMSNQTSAITSLPGFMINDLGQSDIYGVPSQYAWPVSPLGPEGQPAGSTCDMTDFTTGVDGNAGIGNVCQELYSEWLAGTWGVDAGDVSITAGQAQGTVTPGGNYAATAVISNEATTPQQVSLFFSILSGDAALGNLINGVDSNGNAIGITDCTTLDGVLECQATIPVGDSTVTIPLTGKFTSGRLLSGISGSGSYSSSNTDLLPVANNTQLLPREVSNVTVGPDPWADQTQPNGGAPLYASVRWNVPESSLPITGFAIYITDPTGKQSRVVGDAYPPSGPIYIVNESANGQPLQANDEAGIDLPLPDDMAGRWTIGVAAINAGGEGPVVSSSVLIGNGKPLAPTRFQATQSVTGTVRLTWKPVDASPAVTNYAITITKPNGTSSRAVSNVPAFVVENVDTLGQWKFELTAVNAVGASPSVTDTLNVTGRVPTKPLDVDMTVDSLGWLSASWTASTSLPDADAYYVALYAPGSTSASIPTYSTQIDARAKVQQIRLANFYQLAKDSAPGAWILAVTPVNSVGVGEHGAAELGITTGLLSLMTKERSAVQTVTAFPARLMKWAAALCTAGTWSQGANVFGTCVKGEFDPADPTWSPSSSDSGVIQPGVTQTGCSGDTCSTVAGFVSGGTAYLSMIQADPNGGAMAISEGDTQLWASTGAVPTNSVAKATLTGLPSGTHVMTLTSGSLTTTFVVRVA